MIKRVTINGIAYQASHPTRSLDYPITGMVWSLSPIGKRGRPLKKTFAALEGVGVCAGRWYVRGAWHTID